jgi:hypothetical protein
MKNNKIQEKIRDILNEEMYNYGQAKDIGEKDEIFDRTSNQILELFKQSSKKGQYIVRN